MSYYCSNHGFIRKINSPKNCQISDEEFFSKLKSGEIIINKPLKGKKIKIENKFKGMAERIR